jgi:hypothetical protein
MTRIALVGTAMLICFSVQDSDVKNIPGGQSVMIDNNANLQTKIT